MISSRRDAKQHVGRQRQEEEVEVVVAEEAREGVLHHDVEEQEWCEEVPVGAPDHDPPPPNGALRAAQVPFGDQGAAFARQQPAPTNDPHQLK